MDDFQQPGCTHAAADAHRDDCIFGLATASFDQGVPGEPGSGHSIGMPDRNRSAVDVELFRVDPELVAAIDHLHGEGFVQFPEIDIVDRQPMTLEQSWHRKNRSDAHSIRLATALHEATKYAERL